MNNEEKILAILEKMQGDISGLKEDVNSLKAGQARLEQKVRDMDEVLMRTALLQENEVIPKLNILMESHTALLDQHLPERVKKLEEDMAEQKTIVGILTEEFKEFKQRKTW